jgi:hypothetical protein
MENMIHICLENKISFDHAGHCYGSYEANSGKALP